MLLQQFTSVFTLEPDSEVPHLDPQNVHHKNQQVKISEEMVKKKLLQINKTKSAGPNGIHPRVLFELSEIISAPLTKIFNSSIEQRNIPDQWRTAIVSPIFKKGNRQLPSNY